MTVESSIARVTVYRQGAVVTRIVSASEPGDSLVITGLPLALRDGSVRVRVLSEGVRAGAPHVGLHARPSDDPPDTPDEDHVRDLERTVRTTRLRLQTIGTEVAALETLAVPPRPSTPKGTPPPPSPTPARLALERFTHQAIDTRTREARELTTRLAETERELAAARDQARRAGRAHLADRQAVTKAVRIPLAGSASEVRLELDYEVPGARWAPTYAAHVDPTTGATVLHRRAVVAQATGEDWSHVTLALSTALPHRYATLPELASLRIGKRQPAPAVKGYRPPPSGADALFADYDARPSPLRQPTTSAPALHPLAPPDALALPMDAPAVEEQYAAFGGAADMEAEEADDDAFDEMPSPAPMRSAAVGASKPPPAPSKAKARKRAVGRRQPLRDEAESSTPTAPTAFGQLRLAAPDSRQRGKLVPADPRAEYLASLAQQGRALAEDLDVVLRAAHATADQVGRLPLPSGTHPVDGGAFAYTLHAELPVDVPSSGRFQSVALAALTTEADLTYVVVPREAPHAYRVATVTNPGDAPLLPGPVEVHVGGRFVLTTDLPLVAPRGTFTLGLGVEQGIRTARNTTFREERSGNAVVAMNELHHTITITLANPLPRPARLEVRERIPVPAKDAEVAVEEVAVEPPWEPWDQRTVGGARIEGGRVWRFTIPAGAEQTLSAHYVVKIYANNALVGGNRREA
jgi:hypothetical protein